VIWTRGLQPYAYQDSVRDFGVMQGKRPRTASQEGQVRTEPLGRAIPPHLPRSLGWQWRWTMLSLRTAPARSLHIPPRELPRRKTADVLLRGGEEATAKDTWSPIASHAWLRIALFRVEAVSVASGIVSREQKSVAPASDPYRGQSSIETRFRYDQSIRVEARIEASKAPTSMAWKWRRIELLDDTGRASHERSSRA